MLTYIADEVVKELTRYLSKTITMYVNIIMKVDLMTLMLKPTRSSYLNACFGPRRRESGCYILIYKPLIMCFLPHTVQNAIFNTA